MNKYLTAGVSLLAVLGLTLYFRCYPVFLPQFWQSARQTVEQQVSQNVAQKINKDFSGIRDMAKAKLFTAALADYKKQNKVDIRKRIRAEYDKFKDQVQDKFGQTYLLELDCWHWARYIENIQHSGRFGDSLVNGKPYDNLMLFPQGAEIPPDSFFYYFSWVCYKIFTLFNFITVYNFLFYLPLFFFILFLTLLFFFCYRFWGNITALFCCLFVGLAPIFIPRSCAGWFDRDILNLFFPVLIIWVYMTAYFSLSWRKTIFWAVLSGFCLALFAYTWVGWPIILAILVFFEILYVADLFSKAVQYKENVRQELIKHLVVSAVFWASSCVWVVILCGTQQITTLYNHVKAALILNDSITPSIWPNVFSTVSELKIGNYLSIAKATGGAFSLILVLISMLFIFLNIKRYKGEKHSLMMLLIVWFMAMFFFSSKGIRFAMFLLVPLGIFFGWGIEEAYQFFLRKKMRIAVVPLLLLVVCLMFSFVINADSTAKSALPLMNDSWYSVLSTVKKYTPVDSVINSWWDFGDWFKAVSHRRVIFDGQSQNTPQAYWMARVLITDSEEEAVGILRMLNNGGNTAFEIIEKNTGNPYMSVLLLKKAIMLSPQEGKSFLSKYLPPAELKKAAEILYSRPKQKAYFIVDHSMIGKIFPISYLGNWDFIKVYLSRVIRVKSKEEIMSDLVNFGLSQPLAEKYYLEASLMSGRDMDTWVSRRFSIAGIAYQKKPAGKDDLVLFNSGFIYNPAQESVYSYSRFEEKYQIPKSLFLMDGGKLIEKEFAESDYKYSTLVLDREDAYKLVVLSPELGRSIFVRLQFLKNAGLKHFSLFTQEGENENQILVYEVKWD